MARRRSRQVIKLSSGKNKGEFRTVGYGPRNKNCSRVIIGTARVKPPQGANFGGGGGGGMRMPRPFIRITVSTPCPNKGYDYDLPLMSPVDVGG